MSRPRAIIIASLVFVAAVGVFAATAVHALFYAPDTALPVASSSAASAALAALPPAQMPERLEIPSLGIDARIQYLGVNAQGNMQAPSNFTDVGWYSYGTVPGQVGSAVIDGHIDNGLGLDGVFKRLDALAEGDDLYVLTKEGTKLHFVVENVASYPYKEVPPDLLFNRADLPRLNLITCEGGWVGKEKTYDRRRVVYAILVP